MKNRVEALEKAIPEIRERLVRVEIKVDSIEQNMVTKADFADFRAAINGDIADFKTAIKGDIADVKLTAKSDFNELRVIMLQGFNNQIKWFIGSLMALVGIVFAAIRLIQ